MGFIKRHRLLLSILSFVFMVLPQTIDSVWSLAERIRGADIIMPEISIAWFSWITVPIGLILLGIIIFQGRQNKTSQVLTNLAELRKKGVELRNDGMRIKTVSILSQWKKEVENWRETVRSEIEKLSPAQASIFYTEDWVYTERFKNAVDVEHELYLGMLSQDTEKIRRFVERFSVQALARKFDSGK